MYRNYNLLLYGYYGISANPIDPVEVKIMFLIGTEYIETCTIIHTYKNAFWQISKNFTKLVVVVVVVYVNIKHIGCWIIGQIIHISNIPTYFLLGFYIS